MKKIMLLIPWLVFATAGCKKDRTCECSSSYTNTFTDKSGNVTSSNGNPRTYDTKYKKVTHSKMKTLCRDSKYVSTMTSENGTSVSTSESDCTIK